MSDAILIVGGGFSGAVHVTGGRLDLAAGMAPSAITLDAGTTLSGEPAAGSATFNGATLLIDPATAGALTAGAGRVERRQWTGRDSRCGCACRRMPIVEQAGLEPTPIPGLSHSTWAGSADEFEHLFVWRHTLAAAHGHDAPGSPRGKIERSGDLVSRARPPPAESGSIVADDKGIATGRRREPGGCRMTPSLNRKSAGSITRLPCRAPSGPGALEAERWSSGDQIMAANAAPGRRHARP